MTIEQADRIDSLGIDASADEVVLVISDHLSWDDLPGHVRALEAKISAYLDFLASEQHLEVAPQARDLPARIDLIHQHRPGPAAVDILNGVAIDLEERGVRFTYGPLPEGY